ncbi:Scr1 family TA system antitoxin-like transcriptional regulator [Streptomyces rimosus]
MNTHADAPAPAPHLLLSAYLHTLCAERNVSLNDLAASSGHDTRWTTEPGSQPPPQPDQLAALLPLLGVSDPALIHSAQALLIPSAHPHRMIDTAPGWGERLDACQRAARSLRICAPLMVPGIVQTAAYAEALSPPLRRRTAERPRPPRPRLLAAEHAQHVTVVLDEVVLCPGIASAEVMAEQVTHLQQMVEDERMDLRILPRHTGFLPRALCEMTFPHHGRRLYADDEGHPLYVSGPASVCASLRQILDNAVADAAPADASRDLLQQHRQHHERQRLRQMLPKSPLGP